ncbi:MAG: metallophosphoesterase [Planctomycetia bacterium]|nr:metallophosphoesterase [Planctomycetia bacterium]
MNHLSQITRRHLLQSSLFGTFFSAFSGKWVFSSTDENPNNSSESLANLTKNDLSPIRFSFSLNDNEAVFYISGLTESSKIMLIADTHLFRDDERGQAFQTYSGRMAGAYNQTTHFRTGQTTNPESAFLETLKMAQEKKVDSIALLGDMLSFPTESGRDWLLEQLNASSIPFHYISGNHDWHYEGLPGSKNDLRNEWIEKRLKPLYQGNCPLMYAVQMKGMRLVFIDDSTYEILPEQLEFFQNELAFKQPTVLFMHIPPFAPGRSVGFGLGHPNWNAQSDHSFEIERRPRWPESGHNETTIAFYNEILSSPHLLGTFSGHIHIQSLDIINGKPLVVVPTNTQAAYMIAHFRPL